MTDAIPFASKTAFARRAVFTIVLALALLALCLAAWALRTLVLMTFLAVVMAVVLRALGDLIHRGTGLGRRVSVLIVALLLIGAAGIGAAFVAPTVIEQARQLIEKLPQAADALQKRFGEEGWLSEIWGQVSSGEGMPDPSAAVSQAGRVVRAVSASFGYVGVVLAAGLFMALEPGLYREGLVRLVPIRGRDTARELLDELEQTLRSWLGGQLVMMSFIGVFTGFGLWAIGVPYWLALGILAGLLEFIPYLGPILSAVPSLLIALTVGPNVALFTLALLMGVQFVENNVLQPLVQRSAVDVPPALLIVVLFAMGSLFGVAGLLVATPLLAVVIVVVRRLYLEGFLEGASPETVERTPAELRNTQ
jgi:predicted PurR-regulated permease PerM